MSDRSVWSVTSGEGSGPVVCYSWDGEHARMIRDQLAVMSTTETGWNTDGMPTDGLRAGMLVRIRIETSEGEERFMTGLIGECRTILETKDRPDTGVASNGPVCDTISVPWVSACGETPTIVAWHPHVSG